MAGEAQHARGLGGIRRLGSGDAPLLFIVGTAMPFSFSKRIGSEPLWKIYLKVARRVAVLFLLGTVAGRTRQVDHEVKRSRPSWPT